MCNAIQYLSSEKFWLPNNVTWKDVNQSSSTLLDFSASIILCFIILALRYFIEKYCLAHVATTIGLRRFKIKSVIANPFLEKVYLNYNKLESHKQIIGWAKQLDWTEHEVENWVKLRLNQNKLTKTDKFCESGWRFAYYLCMFCFGLFVLWDSSWLWDVENCWRDYPQHPKTSGVWWYYMISLGFYLSLNISQFFDVKRKDFWQLFIHHIITSVLIVFSWITNFFRIGSLIILVHDFADITLEAAKITKYAGYKNLCNVVFAIFTISWIASRLIVFPYWILQSTFYDAPKYTKFFPAFIFFNAILILLFCLHVFWTSLLIRLLYKTFKMGKLNNDIRSSSSEDSN